MHILIFGQTRKKVVMSQRRYECVYKRIADANVPFCEKVGTVKWVTDFSCKRKIGTSETCSDVERKTRFELATFTLAR